MMEEDFEEKPVLLCQCCMAVELTDIFTGVCLKCSTAVRLELARLVKQKKEYENRYMVK